MHAPSVISSCWQRPALHWLSVLLGNIGHGTGLRLYHPCTTRRRLGHVPSHHAACAMLQPALNSSSSSELRQLNKLCAHCALVKLRWSLKTGSAPEPAGAHELGALVGLLAHAAGARVPAAADRAGAAPAAQRAARTCPAARRAARPRSARPATALRRGAGRSACMLWWGSAGHAASGRAGAAHALRSSQAGRGCALACPLCPERHPQQAPTSGDDAPIFFRCAPPVVLFCNLTHPATYHIYKVQISNL